ncbi:MAG TPA: hypothetical protein VFE35_05730 [Candidatus Cybelea sp.]|jgi:hypothetical protein|nr:hypothetical protein [Candidatus Cybelea sp.]
MKISKLHLAALAVVFAIFFGFVGAGIALAAQPHMTNARTYLYDALSELNAANTNKGGHRVNAINLTKQAINEVNLGIQYAQ